MDESCPLLINTLSGCYLFSAQVAGVLIGFKEAENAVSGWCSEHYGNLSGQFDRPNVFLWICCTSVSCKGLPKVCQAPHTSICVGTPLGTGQCQFYLHVLYVCKGRGGFAKRNFRKSWRKREKTRREMRRVKTKRWWRHLTPVAM